MDNHQFLSITDCNISDDYSNNIDHDTVQYIDDSTNMIASCKINKIKITSMIFFKYLNISTMVTRYH